MASKKLAIVILNYNTKDLLEQCIESIKKSIEKSASRDRNRKVLKRIEIIIVDNNSTDGSVEFIKSLTSLRVNELRKKKKKKKKNSLITNSLINNRKISIKLIENDQNLGFTGGNNVGIRHALRSGADYIMLLNNDTLVQDAFWRPMIDFLEKNPRVGIIGPKIYFAPGYEFHQDRYSKKDRGKVIWYAGGRIDWNNVLAFHRGVDEVDRGQYDQPEETEFVSGCCLLAKREVWQEVGLLDEKYFLYYEDADFCLRAKKKGWQIYYLPQAKVWHLNAGSSSCGGPLQDYFITRNRLLFGMRWAPWQTKQALLRESLRTLLKGRRWQKIGVRDFYLRRFGKGSWRK